MSATILATKIEPGRIVRIGKGQVSYRVEKVNSKAGLASIVSVNASGVKLHRLVELSRLTITPWDQANQVPVESSSAVVTKLPTADNAPVEQPRKLSTLEQALVLREASRPQRQTPERPISSGNMITVLGAAQLIDDLTAMGYEIVRSKA